MCTNSTSFFQGKKVNNNEEKNDLNESKNNEEKNDLNDRKNNDNEEKNNLNDNIVIFCPLCKIVCVSETKLKKHIENKHLPAVLEVLEVLEENEFDCEECGMKAISKAQLKKHMQREHNPKAKTKVDSLNEKLDKVIKQNSSLIEEMDLLKKDLRIAFSDLAKGTGEALGEVSSDILNNINGNFKSKQDTYSQTVDSFAAPVLTTPVVDNVTGMFSRQSELSNVTQVSYAEVVKGKMTKAILKVIRNRKYYLLETL